MESTNSALKMKLAWQEAYRIRSCPGDDMLFAEQLTIETQRHLKICPACSDVRNSSAQSRTAWRELAGRLSDGASPHKATEVAPVEGQVWALRDDLSHWGNDGNYYRAPRILLLGIEGNALKVAQIYHDISLLSDGDVLLSGDRFGFAQAWNIYTIHLGMLSHCLGGVKQEEIQTVLNEAGKSRKDIDENSILYWFRTTEVIVGAEIAMPAVAQLLVELESLVSVPSFVHEIFGEVSGLIEKLKEYVLPDNYDSAFGFLAGVRPQQLQLAAADSENTIPVNIVHKTADGVLIETIQATITDDDWQSNRTYLISGKLSREAKTGLHLLATLSYHGETIAECQNRIEEGSPYFDILFKDVPEDLAQIDNVIILLVNT
ncbi:MAG: hypothetical protein PHN84_00130 [Desulfuromonadaceae bacterium]|nr:hypothetical protein [Desulfuromonadaceae bacterium]